MKIFLIMYVVVSGNMKVTSNEMPNMAMCEAAQSLATNMIEAEAKGMPYKFGTYCVEG